MLAAVFLSTSVSDAVIIDIEVGKELYEPSRWRLHSAMRDPLLSVAALKATIEPSDKLRLVRILVRTVQIYICICIYIYIYITIPIPFLAGSLGLRGHVSLWIILNVPESGVSNLQDSRPWPTLEAGVLNSQDYAIHELLARLVSKAHPFDGHLASRMMLGLKLLS